MSHVKFLAKYQNFSISEYRRSSCSSCGLIQHDTWYTVLQWLRQHTDQNLYSQQASHITPSWASYGVSIIRNLDKSTSWQYSSTLNGLTHSSVWHCAPSHFRLLRSNSSILNHAWYELCRVLVKLCYVTTLTVKWHLDNMIFSGCSRFC